MVERLSGLSFCSETSFVIERVVNTDQVLSTGFEADWLV